jgi:hypothetical protein
MARLNNSIRRIQPSVGALVVAVGLSLVAGLLGTTPSTAAPLSADERQRFAFSVLVIVQDLADQVPKISAENADSMKSQQTAVVRSGTLDDYRSLAAQQQFLLWKVNTRIDALSAALNKLVRGGFSDLTAEMEEWKIVVEQLRENDTAVAVEQLHRSGVIAKPVRIDGESVQSVFTDRYTVAYGDIVEPFVKGALKK